MQSPETDRRSVHIAVCIPTYRRPTLLRKCLESLKNQQYHDFSYSVVIVDNDSERSAKVTVDEWSKSFPGLTNYDVEPIRNISLTRNRAIANASGDLIAFIDDDECAEPSWLQELFELYNKVACDGVLGPVKPSYDPPAPQWLIASGLCDRKSFSSGTMIRQPKYLRTGNVLLDRRVLLKGEGPFDPRFGRTGGEDVDFFNRMLLEGRVFIWCNEAQVYEAVPKERQTLNYFVKRALARGASSSHAAPLLSMDSLKSAAAIGIYGLGLPVLMVMALPLFCRYLIKAVYHVSRLLARCGVYIIRERNP
jgi:succinoglycan biosynthesis protein ExoM